MVDIIVTPDGKLAFQFEDQGIIAVTGVSDFFGVPGFVTETEEITYPLF